MLSDLALIGGAAFLGGSLIHPISRRFLLGEVRDNWLMDELELDRIHADDATVILKDGSYFRVYDIYGVNYDAKLLDQQFNQLKTRETLIHILSGFGIHISFYGIKRSKDLRYKSDWPCSTLDEVAEEESKSFGLSYEIKWHMAIWSKSLRKLEEGHIKINSILAGYSPLLIKKANDGKYCELTSFLNYLECGSIDNNIKSQSANLSYNLPASDIFFDKYTGLIVTQTPKTKYHRIISVRFWPETVGGKMIYDVLCLPGDIEFMQYCKPENREVMRGAYKRKVNEKKNSYISKDKEAIEEAEAVLQLLESDNGSLFITQTQILVSADSQDELDELEEKIGAILEPSGVMTSVETEGAKASWFNRTPGYQKFTHPLTVLNKNIASLWAFHFASVGQEASPYGRLPIRLLRTPSGQAYSFQFHVRPQRQTLGNYLVIAPSGSGKSTLINYLLSGMAKFDGTKSYYFDSKEGAKFMIKALGGFYQSYEDLALNPLDVGEDNLKNRQQIRQTMKTMLGEKFYDDLEADKAVEHAVDLAFKVEGSARTFNNLFDLAFESNSRVANSFKKWVTDKKNKVGQYAHIFNAPQDSLASVFEKAHMVGINMNEALEDPILGPSVVTHISTAIEKAAKANKKGYNIFIDEGANLVQNPEFKQNVKEFYRECRKLDGVVGIAFQDPKALEESGIGPAVIENTATFIFFPNAQADEESLKPFNLNKEQIDFITQPQETPGRRSEDHQTKRQVLIVKREAATALDESAIVDIDLSTLGDVMRFFRAGVEANRDIEELQSLHGDKYLDHM